ncbi:hypothetical protein H4R24_004810 [Coemansia sp. RSA 988]|nr:hypothetical protein H4R24_004810 [Coemansia sp. RSA 988]
MEEFYQRTNSIFAATKGIREVQLKIYTLCDIDAMQVYWPHLDYLEICTAVNIETALTLASRAPGLTHLKINNLIPPEQTQQRSDLSAGIEKSVQLNHRQKNSEIRAVSFAFKPEGTSTARELMIAILRTHLPKLEQVC